MRFRAIPFRFMNINYITYYFTPCFLFLPMFQYARFYLSSKIKGALNMYIAFPHLLVYLLLLFHCYRNAIWNICELTGSLGFRFDVSTKNKKFCNLLAITLLNLVSQLSFRQTKKDPNQTKTKKNPDTRPFRPLIPHSS